MSVDLDSTVSCRLNWCRSHFRRNVLVCTSLCILLLCSRQQSSFRGFCASHLEVRSMKPGGRRLTSLNVPGDAPLGRLLQCTEPDGTTLTNRLSER